MLKTPSEFPYPGSYALLDGIKVRVIRTEPGGDLFVSGKGIARTVPAATLVAFTPPRPALDTWIDQRIVAVGQGMHTRTGEAWADYREWHRRTFLEEPAITSVAFSRSLTGKGFLHVRAPLDGRKRRCWGFALAGEARRAA